jgi:uncharacterized membrane protein YccC
MASENALGHRPDRATGAIWGAARFAGAAKAGAPLLLFGIRLWLSVCLALFLAFWLELDNPYWAGASAAVVCQPVLGASLRKGWFRMVGTIVGAVAIVVLTACFPQDRGPFLIGLALWGAACAFLATLLRNFASYAAALAGYTAAIIASGQLGATGGPNGEAFMLAVTRASEICIGIVCAGVVLAGTEFGGTRRRLASLIAALSAEIAGRFNATLVTAGSDFASTQSIRRELVHRVTALDQVIDEALGESSLLRFHSTVLERAVNGLFAAMSGWRTAAVLLAEQPPDSARQDADRVVTRVQEVALLCDQAERWSADPICARRASNAAARRLIALPADTPSLRLLADQTGYALVGISRALDGLALLTDSGRSMQRRQGVRSLYIPDWLPSLVNAGRAFVTIGAVELFWIFTQWPNGAFAVTFAAISVILFAPRADQAYTATIGFMTGISLAAVFAAVIAFAVLPQSRGFVAFGLALGLVLIPAGAGMAQPWHRAAFTALAANFIPLLAPTNPFDYDTVRFYNNALAIVGGLGAGALSFRLLPPLSPAFRMRRLLALSLHDLRRLIKHPSASTRDKWEGRVYARLSAMPEQATPLERARLLTAFLVGAEIIQLRCAVGRFGLRSELSAALDDLARGDVTLAVARLADLDRSFAVSGSPAALRARARILAISQALVQHTAYFEAGGAQ